MWKFILYSLVFLGVMSTFGGIPLLWYLTTHAGGIATADGWVIFFCGIAVIIAASAAASHVPDLATKSDRQTWSRRLFIAAEWLKMSKKSAGGDQNIRLARVEIEQLAAQISGYDSGLETKARSSAAEIKERLVANIAAKLAS